MLRMRWLLSWSLIPLAACSGKAAIGDDTIDAAFDASVDATADAPVGAGGDVCFMGCDGVLYPAPFFHVRDARSGAQLCAEVVARQAGMSYPVAQACQLDVNWMGSTFRREMPYEVTASAPGYVT